MVSYTDEEARQKQCPFMLIGIQPKKYCTCIGRSCMAWVWDGLVDDMGSDRFVQRGTQHAAKGGCGLVMVRP